MDNTDTIKEMEAAFVQIPGLLGLSPEEILGRTFVFVRLQAGSARPEVMTSSILGVAQRSRRHISLAIPKIRFGESFCERIIYLGTAWMAVDISGLQYRGALMITKP